MLRKLIRHEFRATGRMMWPIFAGMLALTAAMRLSQRVLNRDSYWLLNLLAVIITIGFVVGIMALGFSPMVVSAVRFRDHVLRDEGYLTLTLPVSMHRLLTSKLIVSAAWYAAAAIFMMLLLFLLGFTDVRDWMIVPNLFADAFRYFGGLDAPTRVQALLLVLELLLNCVFGVTAVSLIVYAAYAVGYSFNKHKSTLTAVFVLVFFQLAQFAAVAMLARLFDGGFAMWPNLTGVQAGNAFLAVALAGELAVCILFYIITWYFTTKKLNLE